MTMAALSLVAVPIAAQTKAATSAAAKAWTPPKTWWGDPDLQGIYTSDDYINVQLHQNFEYACHEGNNGMMNQLSGARADERAAAAAKK